LLFNLTPYIGATVDRPNILTDKPMVVKLILCHTKDIISRT